MAPTPIGARANCQVHTISPTSALPAITDRVTVAGHTQPGFAGTPLILSISGGTPPYQAFSANPAALPVAQNVNGNTIALLANNVEAAQSANITSAQFITVANSAAFARILCPASVSMVTPPSSSWWST